MTYIEAFETIKKTLKTAKADKIEGHLAVQVNLTDNDAGGILYLEVIDKRLRIEPYDYFDRDAMFMVSLTDFINIMTSKIDFDKAVEDGTLCIYGDLEKANEVKKLIKKPTQRKTSSKKTSDKPAVSKKTISKKTTNK